jgi:prevent-host-death family protein
MENNDVAWQLQEAKQKFSQLVQQALDEGPQVVTRHGEAVVVVVSADEYQRLTGSKRDFRDFLLNGPDLSALDLSRTTERAREVEL